jgi:hypothetical protein
MAEEGEIGSSSSSGARRKSASRGTARKEAESRRPKTAAKDGNGSSADGGKKRARDESEITAPSLGPGTVIEREPVEERLARHEQSEEDAMGKDKRRKVVGHSYGPSKTRQIVLYGIFLLCLAALFIGGKLLVDALDTPVGKHVPHTAPWAKHGASQRPPKPLQ